MNTTVTSPEGAADGIQPPTKRNDKHQKSGMKLLGKCSRCHNPTPDDRLGYYEDAAICDECSETLRPPRYGTELFDITNRAELQSIQFQRLPLGMAVNNGQIILIEDEFGDLVYSSLNAGDVLVGSPTPGMPSIGYLPDDMRGSHRKTQRESVRADQTRLYLATANGMHWTVHFLPFTSGEDRFTLTIIKRAA